MRLTFLFVFAQQVFPLLPLPNYKIYFVFLSLGAIWVSSQSDRSALWETTASTGEPHQRADTRRHGTTHSHARYARCLVVKKDRMSLSNTQSGKKTQIISHRGKEGGRNGGERGEAFRKLYAGRRRVTRDCAKKKAISPPQCSSLRGMQTVRPI